MRSALSKLAADKPVHNSCFDCKRCDVRLTRKIDDCRAACSSAAGAGASGRIAFMKNKTLWKLLNGMMLVLIVLSLLILAALPAVLSAFFKASEFHSQHPFALEIALGCLYACALPPVLALFHLKGFCAQLRAGRTFSPRTASCLRGVARCAFAEAAVVPGISLFLYLAYGVFLYALTVLPCILLPLTCLAAGLFFLALARIFASRMDLSPEP